MIWAAQKNYAPSLSGHCSHTNPQRGLVFFQTIYDADPEGSSFVITGGADDTCLVNGITDMTDKNWIFDNGWSANITGAESQEQTPYYQKQPTPGKTATW